MRLKITKFGLFLMGFRQKILNSHCKEVYFLCGSFDFVGAEFGLYGSLFLT